MDEEKIRMGMEIDNEYELESYRAYQKLQVCMTIVGGFVSLGLVAAITVLVWHFNNPKLMWFFIMPTICYTLG